MNRRYLTWCAVGLGAAFFWGVHEIDSRQGERLARLERKIEATNSTISLLNQDSPAKMPLPQMVGPAEATIIADDPPAAQPTEPTPAPAAKSALPIEASAAGLRLLLQRHPQWNIPEIDLLTSEDFVLFAADLLPESMLDEGAQRQVLRDLRSLAKRRFAAEFQTAIGDYLADHAWTLPRDSGELAPYFPWRVPPAIVHRYEVIQLENRGGMILELAPVDPDYDTLQVIQVSATNHILSWMQQVITPAASLLLRSRAAFVEAEGREPVAAFELQPYLEKPVNPADLQAWFAQWQSNRWPESRISISGGMYMRQLPFPRQ